MAVTNAGGERRLVLLHCVLRTGKGRGTEKRKWTWRSTHQRGRLSGDELAGVTRGDANVEIDGEPSENRKGTIPS